MAHFKAAEEQYAACIICPHRYALNYTHCKKTVNSCSTRWRNDLRKSKTFRTEILSLCHWLYDDDLHYFKIE